MDGFYGEIVERIKGRIVSKDDLNRIKNELSKKHGLKKIPTDADILLNARIEDIKYLRLVTKPTRTLSGVAPIAIMCKPHKCPHGTCIYCPGGPGSVFGDVPQSYTGREPSAMRSMRNRYDPYLVVMNRLEQYVILGQNPEKTEIIIQGGTFLSLENSYKEEFVGYIFKALNDFSSLFYIKGIFNYLRFKEFFELPGDADDDARTKRIHARLGKLKGISDLGKEQKRNETSRIRCVGLTIETKPDYGLLQHGNEMLAYGCTRVELGVQTTDDKILKAVNRGHGRNEIIESTRILKDLGFKVNYHMMPGLPGSSAVKDLAALRETLDDRDFRPDMYKIYPTMVLKGTGLHKMMESGRYKPIDLNDMAELLSEFKRYVPRWIRIMRVQRDIPTNMTEGGVEKTNLRQYVDKGLKEKSIVCQCIRCREAGLMSRGRDIKELIPVLFVEGYDASEGKEHFLSFEDKDRKVLFGYCRLRFPSESVRKEITATSALIRELHVVGAAIGIGDEGDMQHKGLGKKLLKKAEIIAKAEGKDRIVVISGVGAREYYRKLGYSRKGFYMIKKLD
jgi:elongator complex protein 3